MRRLVRFSAILVLFGVIAAVLPACSGINRPFAREKTILGTRDPQAPPVSVAAMDGMPQESARRLAGQLYTESRRRGFTTTVEQGALEGFVLTGQMTAAPTGAGTTVVYVWDVYDPTRKHHERIVGEETIPGASFDDPWNAVDDSALQRIASQTSEQLAGFVSKMGYEIRMASVPPPASMMTGTADSITTASMTGGLTLPPVGVSEGGRVAALTQSEPGTYPQQAQLQDYARQSAPPPQQVAMGEPPASPSSANLAETERPVAAAPRPTAIAVPMVSGAPGSGNEELASAMRRAMRRAGLPVINDRSEGALTIAGEVDIKQADGREQTVALAWKVLDTNGNLIGTIAQNNQIPAGSLDRGWGQTANHAAEAAAGGIFQLLSRGL